MIGLRDVFVSPLQLAARVSDVAAHQACRVHFRMASDFEAVYRQSYKLVVQLSISIAAFSVAAVTS